MLAYARAFDDWLVNVNFAVANLQIEFTVRVCANPSFVVDWCPLSTKVGQRYKTAFSAPHTFRPAL